MENRQQKYAERKMPLFALVVSVWQHNLALKKAIGIGFSESIFTHQNGFCELNASTKEIAEVCERILDLIKTDATAFKTWYHRAKVLNNKTDEMLEQYQQENVSLDRDTFVRAFRLFADNFGICTILSFWVLYSINRSLEEGRSRAAFGSVLGMFEELKSETRYPQLVSTVLDKYFREASRILKVSPELASCLRPDELSGIMDGKNLVSAKELKKRMRWCAITRAGKAYNVHFHYDRKELSNLLPSATYRYTKELKGRIAFKGIVSGRVKIVNTIEDLKKFEAGDILVSIQSSPALMWAIKNSTAIVTDEGGIMCHASIISRELKIPCVIGTKIATKVLRDGDKIEVDANRGIVKKLS